MTDLNALRAQRAALDEQIKKEESAGRVAAISEILAKMQEFGLSLSDLGGGASREAKKTSKNPVAVKYRNLATGETWSGRGLQPKWLKAAVSSGVTAESFLVKP